ncbi:MAG: hypothetical protein LBE50_04255 [Gallionellaceae bacterium]|jgi:hypothetical protein|nr:hypothetical protein [Gallionellaceae bacterium]
MTNPLATTNTPEQNERDKKLWESEDLGGITEDNNRLPVPVVWLLLLTTLTAFAVTFPLWGQRPTAGIYVNYIGSMDDPKVTSAANDVEAMKVLVEMHPDSASLMQSQLVRHPVTMDELRALRPQIEALKNGDDSGIARPCARTSSDLHDYTIIGTSIVCANFEGNFLKDQSGARIPAPDGTFLRQRQQPWWDQGYTIDIFYVIAFFAGVVAVVKRLPPSSWQPTHGHDH